MKEINKDDVLRHINDVWDKLSRRQRVALANLGGGIKQDVVLPNQMSIEDYIGRNDKEEVQ